MAKDYVLHFLTYHLEQAGRYSSLSSIVQNPTWQRLQIDNDPTGFWLRNDLDIAISFSKTYGVSGLEDMIAFSQIYSDIKELGEILPAEALILMALLGEHDQAEQLGSTIVDPVKRVKTLARLITNYLEWELIDRAHILFAQMKDIALRLPDGDERDRAYSFVALCSARLGNIEQAVILLDTIPNSIVREKNFRKLILEIIKIGRCDEASRYLSRISSIPFLIELYGELIFAVAQTSKYENFRQNFYRALEKFDTQKSTMEQISNVVQVLIRLGEHDRAKQLIHISLDPLWFVNGLRGLAQGGSSDLALEYLKEIGLDIGGNVNPADLVEIYSWSKHFEEAMQLLEEIPETLARDGSRATLVWRLAEEGYFSDARRHLAKVKNPYLILWAMAGIGQAYSSFGETRQALATMKEIRELSFQVIPQTSLDPSILLNETDGLEESSKKFSKDQLLKASFDRQLNSGRLAAAHKIAQSIQNRGIKSSSLIELVQEIVKRKRYSDAILVANQITIPERYEAYIHIAKGFAEDGDSVSAASLLQQIDHQNLKDEGQRYLASVEIKKNAFGQAMTLINLIHSIKIKDIGVSELAIQMASAGLMDESLHKAKSITGRNLQLRTFSSIAPYLYKLGNKDVALELLDECRNSNVESTATVLIASQMLEMGEFLEANELISRLSENDRYDAWIGVARSLLQKHGRDLVEEYKPQLDQHYQQAMNWGMFVYFAQTNNFSEAEALIVNFYDARVKHNAARLLAQRIIVEGITASDVSKSFELIRNFVNERAHDAAFTELLRYACENHRFSAAMIFLDRIQAHRYRAEGIKYIVKNAFVLKQDKGLILSIIHSLLDACRQRGQKDTYACIQIIFPLVKSLIGRKTKVRNLVEKISKKKLFLSIETISG